MSFNGSGLYQLPDTIDNGTSNDAPEVMAILTDMATGISNCVAKDGQQTITANLPMNGFKLTGVGPGTSRTDSATVANIQDGKGIYIGNSQQSLNLGSQILLPSPAIAAYADGQSFRWMVTDANTGAVTVSVSGLSSKPLYSKDNTEVIAGDLRVGDMVEIFYESGSGADGAFILGSGGWQSRLTGQDLTNCTLTNCTTTTPVVDGNVANKAYVDALWTTGDVKITLKTTADFGWVMFDDGTIGSASSGATTRANIDTEDLYTLLWENVSDTYCAVSGGRGASASADFSANKTIDLPKVLGRALAVSGAGSGLTSRGLAAYLGTENSANISHTHTATQAAHSHTYTVTSGGAGAFTTVVTAGADAGGAGGGPTAVAQPAITVSTDGASGTGLNMPPSSFLNVMVKL